METNNRATGKTFRAILKALLSVSEGNNTVMVCRNNDMVKHISRSAQRTLNGYGLYDVVYEVRSRGRELSFAGHILIFISQHNFDPSAYQTLTIIEDLI